MKKFIYLFLIVMNILWNVKIGSSETQIFKSIIIVILVSILYELTEINKKNTNK